MPDEFNGFCNGLFIAGLAWQKFGISYSELMAMDLIDQEYIKLALRMYG